VFARRTAWPRAENALARARREGPEPRFDLTVSNPTELDLPREDAAILRALSDPAALTYAPEPLGLSSAREAVARYYGGKVDPARIVLTASTSEAYAYALRLLCDPGDAVAIPRPSYPLFDFLLDLADVAPVPYRLAWDGAWHLDRSSVPDKVKALFLVSPNNPTGSVLDADDRAFLLERARASRTVIVSDEVFADYATTPASLIGADQPVISLSGLSKVAGLPQLKLGWMVINGPDVWASEAMARLEIIADTYLSVSTPVMIALPELLRLAGPWRAGLSARIAENRAALARITAGTAVRGRPSQGGWSAMIDVPRLETDEAWCLRLLAEDGVLVQPGYFFDVEEEGCLVLSLIVPPDLFAEGVRRLVARMGPAHG